MAQIRRRQHLTLRALRAASGVSIATLNNIENGEDVMARRETIRQIADALGVTMGTLAGYGPCEHPVIAWKPGVQGEVVCELCGATVAYAPGYE